LLDEAAKSSKAAEAMRPAQSAAREPRVDRPLKWRDATSAQLGFRPEAPVVERVVLERWQSLTSALRLTERAAAPAQQSEVTHAEIGPADHVLTSESGRERS
jgi:hypothetical protein